MTARFSCAGDKSAVTDRAYRLSKWFVGRVRAISLTRFGTWTIVPPQYTREDSMKHLHWKTIVAGALLAAASGSMLRAQQTVPDLILTNGRIITVDERFTIAQAVALKGERFVAVGTNQEIAGLAGPNT